MLGLPRRQPTNAENSLSYGSVRFEGRLSDMGMMDTTGMQSDQTPIVSAIIPTHGRPRLLERAITSALTQTLTDIEVIVVVDGHDEDTETALAEVDDPRVRVVVLAVAHGPGGARNAGVLAARAEWIAFLDDDDEWLADKLQIQLSAAQAQDASYPIVSGRFIARTEDGDFVWPRRCPEVGEDLSNYLLDRRSPFARSGFVGMPTILAPRDLLLKIPFPEYSMHEDWGWLLESIGRGDAHLIFLEEPLCIVDFKTDRPKQAEIADWHHSFCWIRDYRHLVTPNAYSAFLTTTVARKARGQHDWRAFWQILREALRHGQPKLRHWLIYVGIWLLPATGRRWVRRISFRDADRRIWLVAPLVSVSTSFGTSSARSGG